jgi:hypothetical protein
MTVYLIVSDAPRDFGPRYIVPPAFTTRERAELRLVALKRKDAYENQYLVVESVRVVE